MLNKSNKDKLKWKMNYINNRMDILIKTLLNNKNKKVFILGTPIHGNLGDQAIIYAEFIFLRRYLPEYEIIEIPTDLVSRVSSFINKMLKENDLIFIHGGGNMGDLYQNEEEVRRFIVNFFKENKIISFPQSIYFENNSQELTKSINSYSINNNFILVARENVSKEFMDLNFNNNEVILTPDIVFSLKLNDKGMIRKGISTFFRTDKEKAVSSEYQLSLINTLRDQNYQVTESDTHITNNYYIYDKNRLKYLQKIWREFNGSEVIITDRLHGMIFAYITATPCIVLKNSNPKIESTYYTWLKNCNYMRLIDENTSMEELVIIINKVKNVVPDYKSMDQSFMPLLSMFK